MAMTKEERGTKNWLYQHLLEEGYRTYAKLFWELDFHLTADPRVVGYMDPRTGTITVNRTLEADQISVIIRHEILHGFLQHEKRLLQNLAQRRGLDFDDLSDMDIKSLKGYLYSNSNFNIAGDYEISNLGYTEEDKDVVRNILLNGQTVSGLVTEDKHPDWVDLSIEEMYDKLEGEREDDKDDAQQQQDEGDNSDEGDMTDGGPSGGPDDSDRGDDGDGQTQQPQAGDGDGQDGESQPPSSNTDDSDSSNQTQDGDNPDSDQNSSNQSNNQNSNKNSGDKNSDQKDKNKDGNGGGSSPKYVYGKFIDKNTFLDANGNVVTIG